EEGLADALVVTGPESREQRLATLQKRARAKFLTGPLAVVLAELRSPLEQSYRNCFYCSTTMVETKDGRLTAARCNTRWCLVCGRIRTGIAINKYATLLEELDDPQFVTLSRPNVPAGAL